jgi:hypothetical protein
MNSENVITSQDILNKINYNYSYELNYNQIIDLIKKEKDENLKKFYIKQLEKIYNDEEIFTNRNFIQKICEINKYKIEVLKVYKQSVINIQNYINNILQNIINKISIIPYSIRCICKIIYILIKKKFPEISEFECFSFIGEFFFGKIIIPILIKSDMNAIIIDSVLSMNTRNNLLKFAKILTKIYKGNLFDTNDEMEYTIFNHFIIELIPILNKFYQMLIDVNLSNNICYSVF